MSGERAFESHATVAEQPDRAAHVAGQARQIPAVVRDGLLIDLLGISPDTYCRRKKAGRYAFLLLRPQASGPTEYSGALVARWLNGEDLSIVEGSRFFAKGRAARREVDRRGRPKGRTNQHVAVLGHVAESAEVATIRKHGSVAK